MELRTHASIRDIDERRWNALEGVEAEPHLNWTFLEAMEATGCVRPEVGWAPVILSVHEGEEMLAAAPAYVKGNSDGEFVFDHSWAEFAYQRLRVDYYPKLIVACPFTPATGPRLLMARGADAASVQRFFASALGGVCEALELSSAHVLFPREAEARALSDAGLLLRVGMQFHWFNRGYGCFEDFLSRYNSKHRNQIKRERAELHKQGIELEVHNGGRLAPEIVDSAYEFYCATVDKYFWGRRYLNRAFFEELCSRMPEQVLIVLARQRSSRRAVGGAFNLLGKERMFGRYWGQRDEVKFLHFNVCYYQGIEECIRRGLKVFEPGAGGEHKVARGFEPTQTFSVHSLRDERLHRAIANYLEREREAVAARLRDEPSPLKPFES